MQKPVTAKARATACMCWEKEHMLDGVAKGRGWSTVYTTKHPSSSHSSLFQTSHPANTSYWHAAMHAHMFKEGLLLPNAMPCPLCTA
eukprot:1158585-Pelagomonas_calceolata.AAC.2